MMRAGIAAALVAAAVLAGCSDQQTGYTPRAKYDSQTVVRFAKDCRKRGGAIHLDKLDHVSCKLDDGTFVSID